VCSGAQETIYEYVPAVQPVRSVAVPVGLKPKTTEPQSNNRVMGNYGSLVFSANIQILNLLSIKNMDVRNKNACCHHQTSNPSSDKLTNNNASTTEVNLPTTISGFNNVSGNKTIIVTYPDVRKSTDANVLLTTEPVLRNPIQVNEFTSENIVTDEPELSDEFNSCTETQTPVDIETSTTVKQNEDSTVFTTEEFTSENNSYIDPNNKNRQNKSDRPIGMTRTFYPNNRLDLEIHIRHTDTFNFNK